MKPALRKMKSRIENMAQALEPLRPTIVALRKDEGLLFEGRIWPDFESIHREYPGKFDRYYDGVEIHTVDGRLTPEVTP